MGLETLQNRAHRYGSNDLQRPGSMTIVVPHAVAIEGGSSMMLVRRSARHEETTHIDASRIAELPALRFPARVPHDAARDPGSRRTLRYRHLPDDIIHRAGGKNTAGF